MTRTAIDIKRGAWTFVLALAVLVIVAPATALGAEPPRTLWEACGSGEGAGQCTLAGGVATNPVNGNVYVVDRQNYRIDEFNIWGSFLEAWGWGVADGGDELQTCGPVATPPVAGCRRGLPGPGAGQFTDGTKGIAVDSSGAIYVYTSQGCTGGEACDLEEPNRVQKFDSDGNFLLMFGGQVNRTKVEEREEQEANAEPVTITPQDENLCSLASHDVCGRGVAGGGDGQFGSGPLVPIEPEGSFIAAGPGDTIYVGGQERIEEFDSGGEFLKSLPIPGEGISALTVDPGGNLYVAFAKRYVHKNQHGDEETTWGRYESQEGVKKLDLAGNSLCTLKVQEPMALATDLAGNLYVADGVAPSYEYEQLPIRKFDSNCAEDPTFTFNVLPGSSSVSRESIGIATSSACGINGAALYYANSSFGGEFLRAYYPQPDATLCPPPSRPPTIATQYATVNAESALVRAKINPHFWPDTTYYVQYGMADCKQHPDACETTAHFPGTHLNAAGNFAVATAGVLLEGLQPDTTYYYRFVAKSGGGGPTFGVGEEEKGGSFTTYPSPGAAKTDCPNQTFRTGPSARLPDCRAYEMVSPVDKDGGDIITQPDGLNEPSALDQAAVSGERMTYSSYRAFGDAVGSPFTSQYLATRGSDGWSSTALSPPTEGERLLGPDDLLNGSYKAFDQELCNGWLLPALGPSLAADAVGGYANLYRRENCGPAAGSYEAMTRVAPTFESGSGEILPLAVEKFEPTVQGFSDGGSHIIFTAAGNLAGIAPCDEEVRTNSYGLCPSQLYDYHAGEVKSVCVLPNERPVEGFCSAGTAGRSGPHAPYRNDSVYHAISNDGSRIFWTVGAESGVGPGRLYVRRGGNETDLISSAPAQFWTASADGARAIYTVPYNGLQVITGEGDLWEWDVDQEARQRIAVEVAGVMGASEDARRIYFVSRGDLTGEEENHQGEKAQLGKPNLYLYRGGEAGGTTFIATLARSDVQNQTAFGAISTDPSSRTSYVSPNGEYAVFTSTAPLTGADNTDPSSQQPVTEVFFYEAGSGALRCVSCNPGGAVPQAARKLIYRGRDSEVWWAGEIPPWIDQLQPARVLSDDGSRLFFESTEPLVLADTNGKADVYEWQRGNSQRECEALGAELFLRREGGCISLISSGQNPADSQLIEASSSGRDIFFRTNASLLVQDPGQIDIYDAREGGGFPPPPAPRPACEGEACQSPPAPPNDPTPASSAFAGAGNVRDTGKATRKRAGCPKGKVRRKGKAKGKSGARSKSRCVKRRRHRVRKSHHRRAHHRPAKSGRGGAK